MRMVHEMKGCKRVINECFPYGITKLWLLFGSSVIESSCLFYTNEIESTTIFRLG